MEIIIPKGYKQTEVGVIPEDWEEKSLKQLSKMKSGMAITEKMISVYGKYACYGGNGLRGFTETFNQKGEFVLIGRQGALCGNVLFVKGVFFASEHAIVVSAFHDIDVRWLSYVLVSMKLNQYSESSAQPGLSVTKILNLKIGIPLNIREQSSIAIALSDVDNLFASLEHLIEKKKAIKQGAMQELLTGKKRLPGFEKKKGYKQTELGLIPEDWEIKKILEFAECFSGGTPNTSVSCYWGGVIPWMSSGELHKKKVFFIDQTISTEGYHSSSTKMFPPKTVLIGLAGQGKTRGTTALSEISLCTNQSIAGVFPSEFHQSEYLYYNLDNRYIELRRLSTGDGSRGGLNLGLIKNIFIPIPSLHEQSAIAKVLSDMDSEIEILEKKVNKYKQIKQGMMQNLLTGKIRLKF